MDWYSTLPTRRSADWWWWCMGYLTKNESFSLFFSSWLFKTKTTRQEKTTLALSFCSVKKINLASAAQAPEFPVRSPGNVPLGQKTRGRVIDSSPIGTMPPSSLTRFICEQPQMQSKRLHQLHHPTSTATAVAPSRKKRILYIRPNRPPTRAFSPLPLLCSPFILKINPIQSNSTFFQAAHFSSLCQPPSLNLGPSPLRATPPKPLEIVLPPRPPADGAVSADMLLLVVSCFVRAAHCTPPLIPAAIVGEEGWGLVEGEAGEEGGIGFGPEHLGEVDALSKLTADVFKWDGGIRVCELVLLC